MRRDFSRYCSAVEFLKCLFLLFPVQYLVALGTGGIKPCVATFGADQFNEDDPAEKEYIPRFYNWFYAFISIGSIIAGTLVVWIQANVR